MHIIDAHAHAWVVDPQRYPWQPLVPNLPAPAAAAPVEDLLVEMASAGVRQAVLTQPAIYGEDNRYLAEVVARCAGQLAGIALVDPQVPGAMERAAYWLQQGGLRGLRLNPGLDPHSNWLDDAAHSDLWELVSSLEAPLSLRIAPSQLPALGHMLTRFPRVRVVIDYLNPQAYTDAPGYAAFEQLARLARHPGVYAKLLPLTVHSRQPFPFADLFPAYERLYRALGAQRLLWGSSWPDNRARLTYAEAVAWGRALPFLTAAEQAWFMGGTARSLWRLPLHTPYQEQ